jgi:hypothetical protein
MYFVTHHVRHRWRMSIEQDRQTSFRWSDVACWTLKLDFSEWSHWQWQLVDTHIGLFTFSLAEPLFSTSASMQKRDVDARVRYSGSRCPRCIKEQKHLQ